MLLFLEALRQARAELDAQNGDPWRLPLERLHGKIGDDGIERITTQLLFDILEVPQRSRGAGACRRLAKQMSELGWMAVRVRGLTRGGYFEQVRGYCRDARNRQPTYNSCSSDCLTVTRSHV
jgi:hypothetical protein